MKTKEQLPDRLYRHKKNRNVYPLNEAGDAIDLDNPIPVFDSRKYTLVGENNHFQIYDLRVTKYK